MEGRNELLFMAPLFGAVVCETHETYNKFTLKTYNEAVKFCKFLETKHYHHSSIVGHHEGGFRVTIWFIKEK